jgi:hypothetical protein
MPNTASIHRRRDEIVSELRLLKARLKNIGRQTPKDDRPAVEIAILEIDTAIKAVQKVGLPDQPITKQPSRLKPLFSENVPF